MENFRKGEGLGNFLVYIEGAGPLEGLTNIGWGAEDIDKSVIEEFEKTE